MKQENGKVWIEGVPDMGVGERWDMLLRGVEIVLRRRGEETSLDDLMAYSGDAFNLCFASFWQDSAYLCIPTDTLANVAQAYGYSYEWLISPPIGEMRKMDRESRKKITRSVLDRIYTEIDKERPVMAGGSADGGCAPWSVVVGYDKDKMMMSHIGIGPAYRWTGIRGLSISMSPADGKSGFWNGRVRGLVRPGFAGGWLNNPVFILGDKTETPSEEEKITAALKRAVELFRARPHRVPYWGSITYHFGQDAYDNWANALSRLDYPDDLDKPRPREAFGWYDMNTMDVMIDCVLRARAAAAKFCERAASVLPPAADQLKRAARLYEDEVEIVENSFSTFIPAFVGSQWDRRYFLTQRRRREDGVAAIDKIMKKEELAIGQIELALAGKAANPSSRARSPKGTQRRCPSNSKRG